VKHDPLEEWGRRRRNVASIQWGERFGHPFEIDTQ